MRWMAHVASISKPESDELIAALISNNMSGIRHSRQWKKVELPEQADFLRNGVC